jgi:hypothetical protein
MPFRIAPCVRISLTALCAWTLARHAPAQELREQPIPFSVWLDFKALMSPNPPHVGLPIWLESVTQQHNPATETATEQTSYRIRLRRLGQLNREIRLRLFFDDRADANPTVSGWTETGTLLYQSDPLGSGLELPNSADLNIPVEGMDYLDVTVPGDGSNLRGTFLNTLKKTEGVAMIDFPPGKDAPDPFGNLPAAQPPVDDILLYGRVRAALEPKAVKLEPDETLDFDLDRQPLVAVVTFEVLNVDIAFPPQVTINGQSLGAAKMRLPDLADPGYRGEVLPFERDMRFRYAGWLPCQAVIPGSALHSGLNRLRLVVDKEGGSVAVRAVELQLKHNWQGLEHNLKP